jgi:hypothetical protein
MTPSETSSEKTAFSYLNNELSIGKLPAKWIRTCLNADQQGMRVTTFRSICSQFENSRYHLVTKDKTCVHHYNPETQKVWRAEDLSEKF